MNYVNMFCRAEQPGVKTLAELITPEHRRECSAFVGCIGNPPIPGVAALYLIESDGLFDPLNRRSYRDGGLVFTVLRPCDVCIVACPPEKRA